MLNENNEQREKLLHLIREIVQQDKLLREKYFIGDKFRFIRDRLHKLLHHTEESLTLLAKQTEKKSNELLEDEALIYIYLFNAHGQVFHTWQKMLNPSVFYEHSVNRPIYTEKSHVEAFIRSKLTPIQHGYITIAIKKSDILASKGEPVKDTNGNPVIKVREGSLLFNRLVSFTHNGQNYVMNTAGVLLKE